MLRGVVGTRICGWVLEYGNALRDDTLCAGPGWVSELKGVL